MAPENPRNFHQLLQNAPDSKYPQKVIIKLQVLYHPLGIHVPPEVFPNGFEQLAYTDVFGRDMFLPLLDKARAALPRRSAPITMLELGKEGLYDPRLKIIDIRTRRPYSGELVFDESRARTGTSGDQ